MPYCFDKPIATTATCLLLYQLFVAVTAQSATYPTKRFVLWDKNNALSAADTLGYNSTSWDNPGTNPIEMLTYEMLSTDISLLNALEDLEIDKQSWDCYINHYRGYTWPDLANTYKNAYRTLGWTHVSWNQLSDPPESEHLAWDMLNSQLRDAAKTLCYFENLWDSIPIYEWDNENSSSNESMVPSAYPTSATVPSSSPLLPEQMSPSTQPLKRTSAPSSRPVLSVSMSPTILPTTQLARTSAPSSRPVLSVSMSPTILPTTQLARTTMPSSRPVLSVSMSPTIVATTQLTIPIPNFRFVQWSKLNDDTRILAILLGYTQDSWDLPGLATIEHMSFDTIKASNESERIAYIQALGFGKPSWDCFMTHYRSYNWKQLSEYGVKRYYETLGWTEHLWNKSETPRTKFLVWNDLNVSERIAAESLCYFEPTWNNITLQDEVAWRVKPSLLSPSSSSSSYSVKMFSFMALITSYYAMVEIMIVMP